MSFQNELIIQIMTESHEIDSLKRKIEDAKMKLLTEIKVLSTKINQTVCQAIMQLLAELQFKFHYL